MVKVKKKSGFFLLGLKYTLITLRTCFESIINFTCRCWKCAWCGKTNSNGSYLWNFGHWTRIPWLKCNSMWPFEVFIWVLHILSDMSQINICSYKTNQLKCLILYLRTLVALINMSTCLFIDKRKNPAQMCLSPNQIWSFSTNMSYRVC